MKDAGGDGEIRRVGGAGDIDGAVFDVDPEPFVVLGPAQVGGVVEVGGSIADGVKFDQEGVAHGAATEGFLGGAAGDRKVGRAGNAGDVDAGLVDSDVFAFVEVAAADVGGVGDRRTAGIESGHKGVSAAAEGLLGGTAGDRKVGGGRLSGEVGETPSCHGDAYGEPEATKATVAAEVGVAVLEAAAEVGRVDERGPGGVQFGHEGVASASVGFLGGVGCDGEVPGAGRARDVDAGGVDCDAAPTVVRAATEVAGVDEASRGVQFGDEGVEAAGDGALDGITRHRQTCRRRVPGDIQSSGGVDGDVRGGGEVAAGTASSQIRGVDQHGVDHECLGVVVPSNIEADPVVGQPPEAPFDAPALSPDRLVDGGDPLRECPATGEVDFEGISVEGETLGAIEGDLDDVGVGAGAHDEVVLEAAFVAVPDQVDAGIDVAVGDLGKGGHARLPVRRVITGEVVGDPGQLRRLRWSGADWSLRGASAPRCRSARRRRRGRGHGPRPESRLRQVA